MTSKHEEERNAMLTRLENERREAEQTMALQRKKHEEEMRVRLAQSRASEARNCKRRMEDFCAL